MAGKAKDNRDNAGAAWCLFHTR